MPRKMGVNYESFAYGNTTIEKLAKEKIISLYNHCFKNCSGEIQRVDIVASKGVNKSTLKKIAKSIS